MSLRAIVVSLAFVFGSASAVAQNLTSETNIDYFGGDYASFIPAKPNPDLCRKACEGAKRCVAYTFVRPTKDSARGKCYLKAKLGKRTANKCCVSGKRKAAAGNVPQRSTTTPRQPRSTTAPGRGGRRPQPSANPTEPSTSPPQNRSSGNAAGATTVRPNFADRLGTFKLPTTFLQPGAEAVDAGRVVRVPSGQRRPRSTCPPHTQEKEQRLKVLAARYASLCREESDKKTTATDCDEVGEFRARSEVYPPVDFDGDGHRPICDSGTDCDDTDPNRFPGNTEVADAANKDEDCDPMTFGKVDADKDGYFDSQACNDNGGFLYCGTDCDDSNPRRNPGHLEACDQIDNDCNGLVDDGQGPNDTGVMMTVYRDADRDGFGDAQGQTQYQCHPTPGWVANNYDCDDGNAGVNPITGGCR